MKRQATTLTWTVAALLAVAPSLPAQTARSAETLVVVGIDGLRPDYLGRADVPTLRALAARGVRAEGLIPPFPSKTFPSFTTIATGLFPAHHGIVNNTMHDPTVPGRFALNDRVVRSDPRWWLGEPLWNTAERQGVRTAGLFWPGDDVEILGRRPSDYRPYDDDFPNDRRVATVLEWLSRPLATRPRLVMAYVSLVDVAAHDDGPLSPQALAAAAEADRLLGTLVRGIAARGLEPSTNLVVVSDHGLAETDPGRVILLDELLDLSAVDVIESGPIVRLRPKDVSSMSAADRAVWVKATLAALAGTHARLTVFDGAALPARFHTPPSPRVGAVIALADDGWLIQTRAQRARWLEAGGRPRGEHGFDPALRSMHGVFVAAGPAFRPGRRLPPFESRHLYEMFCAVLGIQPSKNDGDRRVLARALAPGRR